MFDLHLHHLFVGDDLLLRHSRHLHLLNLKHWLLEGRLFDFLYQTTYRSSQRVNARLLNFIRSEAEYGGSGAP